MLLTGTLRRLNLPTRIEHDSETRFDACTRAFSQSGDFFGPKRIQLAILLTANLHVEVPDRKCTLETGMRRVLDERAVRLCARSRHQAGNADGRHIYLQENHSVEREVFDVNFGRCMCIPRWDIHVIYVSLRKFCIES